MMRILSSGHMKGPIGIKYLLSPLLNLIFQTFKLSRDSRMLFFKTHTTIKLRRMRFRPSSPTTALPQPTVLYLEDTSMGWRLSF